MNTLPSLFKMLQHHAASMLGLAAMATLVSCAEMQAPAPPPPSAGTSQQPALQGPKSTGTNVSGDYRGSYTYGTGYGNIAGQSVAFHITINQPPGSDHFTGILNEDYTGFGTPRDGRLWADIEGSCHKEGGVVNVRFVKTYRYFSQESVTYSGTVPAGGGQLSGSWHFSSDTSLNGTFSIGGVHP